MTPHASGVLVAVLGALASVNLASSQRIRAWWLRRRAARTAVSPAPHVPVRLPVTASNRAMRDRRANVVLGCSPELIADKLGPYDAELRDLQELADELADEDSHTREQ